MSLSELGRHLSDTDRYRRALRVAFREYVRRTDYGELKPSAARKLKRLQADGLRLAMAAFARDVRVTTQSIIDLCARGNEEEAHLEKAALAVRAVNGWALKKVGFNFSRLNRFEIAAPLEIGLGTELQSWLVSGRISGPQLTRWLTEDGPLIEHFENYAARSLSPASLQR